MRGALMWFLLGVLALPANAQVSPADARRLNEARAMQEQGRHDSAAVLLQELRRSGSAEVRIQALRMLAWSAVAQQRNREALALYEELLDQPQLPGILMQEATRNVISLAVQAERHPIVIKRVRALPTAQQDAEMLLLLSQSLLAVGRKAEAVTTLQQALGKLRQNGTAPSEAQLQLLRYLQQETADWDGLRKTLQQLVSRFPRRDYWLHLAETWRRLGKPRRQSAALLAAYAQGHLEAADILSLAGLLLQQDNPQAVSRLLESAQAQGALEKSRQTIRLQYLALQAARETAKARKFLETELREYPDADLRLLLASSYLEEEHWQDVLRVLAPMKTEKPQPEAARAALYRGIAQARLGQIDKAQASLRIAQQDDDLRKSATQWLLWLEGSDPVASR